MLDLHPGDHVPLVQLLGGLLQADDLMAHAPQKPLVAHSSSLASVGKRPFLLNLSMDVGARTKYGKSMKTFLNFYST